MSQHSASIRQTRSANTSLATTLSPVLSPMLQHAVRLLQMSSFDFAEQVDSVVASNPFVEVDDDCAWSRRSVWTAEIGTGGSNDRTSRFDSSDASELLDAIPATISLHEHLRSQLRMRHLDSRSLTLATLIASSLDDDGYLRDDLESLATVEGATTATYEEMAAALHEVQTLDPAGVGARSLPECLLLQSSSIESAHTRSLAQTIVAHHIDLLASGNLCKLAERMGALYTDVQIACDAIRRLDPRPGLEFGVRLTQFVVPDVIARREANGGRRWTVEINDAVVPKLKLNAVYVDLFYKSRESQSASGSGSGDGSTSGSASGSAAHLESEPAAMDDLQSQITQARWTVRNIAQRFATIRDVANVIVERQQLFLEHGPLGMKPMSLRDVASEIGVHESTVSRVTNNKFISTPYGTFELKHFFSRGMSMDDGKECSPEAVKELVQKCITEESNKQPLSDAAIARMIQSQGVSVARRTVTKYRQLMRIAPVAQRGSKAMSMRPEWRAA